MEHKKAIENRTPLYFGYIMNFTNCYPFWAFLLLCNLVSNIFTIFSMGSEVCLEQCDSYGNFGYLKKKLYFFIREILRKHIVLLLKRWLCSSSYHILTT